MNFSLKDFILKFYRKFSMDTDKGFKFLERFILIFGGIATIVACAITFIAVIAPQQTLQVIVQAVAVETPTPIIITVILTPTPLPPTATDIPTATPEPTDTPTSPPTSTPTPIPEPTKTPTLEPTDTPVPTNTPKPTFTATSTKTPTSTPVPISTVLAPRESWEQDEVVLTLAGGFYDVDNSCIGMVFEFKNDSSDTLIVAGKARNFKAVDNLGQSWKLTMLGGTWIDFNKCKNTIDEQFLEKALGPGEEFDKYSDFSEKGFYVGFTGPLMNNSVNYLDVIVDDFSRITNARWRIPINH